MSGLARETAAEGIKEGELKRILRYLVAKKDAYFVDDNYLHASVVDSVRGKLVAALEKSPAGMTVAQFRDLINGNRKICLLLFAQYDREGTTERQGDVRVLKKA
jgi:hypothetical protein